MRSYLPTSTINSFIDIRELGLELRRTQEVNNLLVFSSMHQQEIKSLLLSSFSFYIAWLLQELCSIFGDWKKEIVFMVIFFVSEKNYDRKKLINYLQFVGLFRWIGLQNNVCKSRNPTVFTIWVKRITFCIISGQNFILFNFLSELYQSQYFINGCFW